ncbi:DNA topoisomerase 2 isoform X2 [Populus trichocarpa]|uniref:DNA topoisomerase 2 isoform X2 n=1 Tax=Populus trichocarpa TaxID=3694 RepID=UPI0022775B40|nr:DNA topoisomerase 2 isoform X2 [Populus trichocarpa]
MAAATKKVPLATSNSVNMNQGKTIEETYQKKSQLEHILLRPDTYIGSIEKHAQTLWVYEGDKIVHRPVTYVPGLYKIFDEILVNAADNKQRDPKMDSLKVVIDGENNLVSVYNNGDGVPVEIHKEEGVYVPELIFGHLLTSSNYDDAEKKTTGGRNGYGAKLTNIFSTEFVIETADGKRQKKYKQVFSNNMGKKSEPMITKCKEGENWTKVTFKPDLAKFSMTHLEEDVVALMKKRVVDIAGCLGKTVKVELNGSRVPVKSFQDYVYMYLNSASEPGSERPKSFYEKVGERWEVCVSLTEGQFQQVSFVNSIATIKGGTHVDYVTNQITNYVMNAVNKKHKNSNIKAHNVKNYLWVFVNCLIDNPAFDSQTKETLTLRQSSFGSKCELSEDFLKKVAKSDIVDNLLSWAKFKESKELKKTDGTKTAKVNVPKLEDANEAGGRYSEKCTLILTEGDSAKALAIAGVAGLTQTERSFYGVFPLRGKLLNVREATPKQLKENKEIECIKKILGLQHHKQYSNVKSLRYGHLMIMTDQDHDGSHIKGLLINFLHSFWPSLLKVPSFLVEFITPIVKATHRNGTVLSFYSMPEYESWKGSLAGNASGWSIKYYKGLGTSTSKEGKAYFQSLDKHKKDFIWMDEQDGDAIELAFSKKKIEARKNWLRQYEPGTHLDQNQKLIKYSDFINKELILFSMADLQRSIPSMVDGLKPGQRKILFCSFKRNFVKEAKISQFSGYVSEHSAYHHGEQSLASTIIGMAQDFVGSNNINLLLPNGQFGTRSVGGKDHASARYIYTQLSPITRFLFPKDDDGLLDYLDEDGQTIEPNWYMPIIPMVLVNGCEGIGTGWSTFIPNYNPRDIVANIRRLLNGEMMEPMNPWYRGFKGTIEKGASKEAGCSYTVNGVINEVNETTLRITELPIRRWTDDYKAFLNSVTEGNRDENGNLPKDPFIKDFRKYGDDATVVFEVLLSEENMMIAKQEGLLKKFKLTTTISTSNMHLFDSAGVIKKYDNPEQILEEFFHLRLEYYERRKKVLLENLEFELLKLENKVRFILGVVRGEIIVNNRKRADLFLELHQKGFTPIPKKSKAVVAGATDDKDEAEDSLEVSGVRASDYDYLLSMAIGTLTLEKVQQLCADHDKLNGEVDNLRKTTPIVLWVKDLEALEMQLDVLDKYDAEAEEARKKLKGDANGEAGFKVSKQAPKNPRKYTKKAINEEVSVETMGKASSSAMETGQQAENAAEVVKPKGRAGSRKAPAKKEKPSPISDEDDEIESLKDRLKAYRLDSSPEQSADMETEVLRVPAGRNAARNKPLAAVSVISDSEDEPDLDDDFDVQVKAVPETKKKGGRKAAAANDKAAKPPAATKRRGPASKQSQGLGQQLLTEMLKPAEESGISPEKKVRKMRASPFNKKSGSLLGGIHKGDDTGIETMPASTSENADVIDVPAKARPQRANRKQTTYVLSDSESEDSDFEQASEDSDSD